MEKGNQEIIAYRIGESLFCPDCHEKAVRTLKSVQKPEDTEVTIPSKPIKAEDLNIYICTQCKRTNTSSEIKISFGVKQETPVEEEKSLMDLQDMVEDTASKISFLGNFLINYSARGDEVLDMNKDDSSGLIIILREIQDDLEFVTNKLSEKQQKGLVIERSGEIAKNHQLGVI